MVYEDERGHGLDDGHRAGHNAGIMAAASGQFRFLAVNIDGFLRAQNGGGRFKGDVEENFLAVCDPALNSTRAIAGRSNMAVTHFERIVVFGTLE